MSIKSKAKKNNSPFRKTWDFIWNSNSIWSWVVNVIIAFVLIKFLIYPGLGLVLGTNLPVVAVISESMEHQINTYHITQNDIPVDIHSMCGKTYNGTFPINLDNGKTSTDSLQISFDTWWSQCGAWYQSNANISKEKFSKFRFTNGFNKGDLMVLIGKKTSDIKIGDVVVYSRATDLAPIIHRIVGKYEVNGKTFFKIKGDNNGGPIFSIQEGINENGLPSDSVIGVAVARIPYLGWVKLGFSQLFSRGEPR